MRKSKEQSQNKFVRIITLPIRVLGRARDMYVRNITKCGHNMNYSNPVDAAGRFEALPRSYSAATSRSGGGGDNEDFAELLRAASARTLVNRIDVDLVLKQQSTSAQPVSSNGLPKSVSVGMGRIDEDTPYDLVDVDVPVVPNSYPRSRSYAVGKTSGVL
ncbi:uncharacterized protein LOC133314563 [Gastrolobium bilobum]|uniref:uncharacterized protein LOC133314563 n=1 Tax=Gastrolobium bilobum TaxID=150636 RepID=UPI002AB2E4A6|nr:uncharacterized protein LOC133314563 [Gastrolobium bilobum]